MPSAQMPVPSAQSLIGRFARMSDCPASSAREQGAGVAKIELRLRRFFYNGDSSIIWKKVALALS